MEKKKIIVAVVSVLLVLALIIGISYALEIFQGTSLDNTIKSGKIAMSYTESSNVISIENALPMSDTLGKEQTNYFDFSITSNADTNTDDNEGIKIPYNLILEPKAVDADKDALANNQIKVYLTKIEGGVETEVLDAIKISELTASETNFNLYSAENIHKNENGKITTKYRLRAWIDYNVDSSTWQEGTKQKQYKFAVNVNATGSNEIGPIKFIPPDPRKDKSGANVPILSENMIAVYYDDTDDSWKKADNETSWYNYDEKKWANAVTVNDTNRSTYLSAESGTPIQIEDVNTMWVWIPRYKYTYFASNTPTEIPITFESGISSTGTIKCTDAIVANSGKSENCTDTISGDITKGVSTYTHPAFTFGDEELTGLWVGKFENSGSATVTIIPDVRPSEFISVSTFFKYARNMELADNVYGFPQTSTTLNNITGEITGDSNNLDTHMMKNMEWGAVAYLSHSKYGKNGEVFINNSFYTGRSGGNVGGSTPENAIYTDQTETSQHTIYGYYTYDGYLLNYHTDKKSSIKDMNKVASTTGNIYGIYDMSGGGTEYVMGNVHDESNAFFPLQAGTWSATDKPLDKYYDKYSYGTSYIEYTRGKLGDATIEMQPTAGTKGNWYNDTAVFAYPSYPWFFRGELNSDVDAAGVFAFRGFVGMDFQIGTRTVLSISSD